ncbi:MAG TPA: PQQ-dependent sugar dehydrogenase [Bacteroidia bacterium]|nr:PQQ-dependent sugar dehydrogenase [Bacteroidia bacterium]
MNRAITGFILVLAQIIFSCANRSSSDVSDFPNDSISESVENRKANSDFSPAFKGQTRIRAVKTQAQYSVSILSEGLNRPWGIALLPDGRLLITEKQGNMRIVTSSGTIGQEISGLPQVNSNGQGGLLGLTVDPQFKQNRIVYWTFSEKGKSGNVTAVGKGRLSDDEKNIENAKVIYRALPEYDGVLHYGSRIIFDRNGNLFVSTGERSDRETRPQAQKLNSALGKIVRITTDGKPADRNPFINKPDVLPEIFSYGHRNVQGLAIHPVSKELWANEFGPRGGDELNLIQAGKNYGWPLISYGIEYNGSLVGNGQTQMKNLEQPVYYWDPVLSPSGMTFYHNGKISEWENNLFICGLNSSHIARLIIENNIVVGEERLLENEGQRFRDIVQGFNGELYVITDEGRLYKIE